MTDSYHTNNPADRCVALLKAGGRVAKSAATILDYEELLQQTVDSICAELDYYYAGVFLTDESGQWAVLHAANGEAGAKMLSEGHKLAIGGNSMVGMAIEQRKMRLSSNVEYEEVHFDNPYLPSTRSEMVIPLITGDEILGAITIQSLDLDAFQAQDIFALQMIADQLSIAVRNLELQRRYRDLLRQTERRARLLRAANQVTSQTVTNLNLNEILAKLVDIICERYGFYYAGVFLLDESREWAVLHAGHGGPGTVMLAENHRLKVDGNSMIGASIRLQEARIAMDVGAERVHFKNPHLPHTRSEMALPLVFGSTVLGAITIQSVEERAFSQDDIITLQAIANHLAVVVKNYQDSTTLKTVQEQYQREEPFRRLMAYSMQILEWIVGKNLLLSRSLAKLRPSLSMQSEQTPPTAPDLEEAYALSDQILALLERVPVNHQQLNNRPALLIDVIRSAVYHSGEQSAVHITTSDHLAMVHIDTAWVSKAFGQLIQNSLEAGADRIDIRVENHTSADVVRILVSDNGSGVKLSDRVQIWQPFFTTKDGPQSGLGLTGCQFIFASSGGNIRLQENVPSGAVFEITLPITKLSTSADLSGFPTLVLLIDDDDTWANYTADALAEAGIALRRRSSPNIDPEAELVLVDEALMDFSLSDVIEALKVNSMSQKAVILSVEVSPERRQAYQKAGVKQTVQKPYTLAELAKLVERLSQHEG